MRGYGFDDASRITSLIDKQGATTTQSATVTYDELDRLKSAEQTGALAFNQVFGYDLIGNRITQTVGGQASTLAQSRCQALSFVQIIVLHRPSGLNDDFLQDPISQIGSDLGA